MSRTHTRQSTAPAEEEKMSQSAQASGAGQSRPLTRLQAATLTSQPSAFTLTHPRMLEGMEESQVGPSASEQQPTTAAGAPSMGPAHSMVPMEQGVRQNSPSPSPPVQPSMRRESQSFSFGQRNALSVGAEMIGFSQSPLPRHDTPPPPLSERAEEIAAGIEAEEEARAQTAREEERSYSTRAEVLRQERLTEESSQLRDEIRRVAEGESASSASHAQALVARAQQIASEMAAMPRVDEHLEERVRFTRGTVADAQQAQEYINAAVVAAASRFQRNAEQAAAAVAPVYQTGSRGRAIVGRFRAAASTPLQFPQMEFPLEVLEDTQPMEQNTDTLYRALADPRRTVPVSRDARQRVRHSIAPREQTISLVPPQQIYKGSHTPVRVQTQIRRASDIPTQVRRRPTGIGATPVALGVRPLSLPLYSPHLEWTGRTVAPQHMRVAAPSGPPGGDDGDGDDDGSDDGHNPAQPQGLPGMGGGGPPDPLPGGGGGGGAPPPPPPVPAGGAIAAAAAAGGRIPLPRGMEHLQMKAQFGPTKADMAKFDRLTDGVPTLKSMTGNHLRIFLGELTSWRELKEINAYLEPNRLQLIRIPPTVAEARVLVNPYTNTLTPLMVDLQPVQDPVYYYNLSQWQLLERKGAYAVRNALDAAFEPCQNARSLSATVPIPLVIPQVEYLIRQRDDGKALEINKLINAIESIQRRSFESIESYSNRFKVFLSQMEGNGQPYNESLAIDRWIKGANMATEIWSSIVQIVDTENPPLDTLIHRAGVAERMKERGRTTRGREVPAAGAARGMSAKATAKANAATANKPEDESGGACLRCGKMGHRWRKCTKLTDQEKSEQKLIHKFNFSKKANGGNKQKGRNKKDSKDDTSKSKVVCNHCEKPGHTQDKCFKLHGYPNKPAEPKDTSTEAAYSSAPLIKPIAQRPAATIEQANYQQSYPFSKDWVTPDTHSESGRSAIAVTHLSGATALNTRTHTRGHLNENYAQLDSAATTHMLTPDASKAVMQNVKEESNTIIYTAGSEELQRPLKGSVEILLADGSSIDSGALTHKDMNQNLISVNELVKLRKVKCVVFDRNEARVYNDKGHIIIRCEQKGGQFVIPLSKVFRMHKRGEAKFYHELSKKYFPPRRKYQARPASPRHVSIIAPLSKEEQKQSTIGANRLKQIRVWHNKLGHPKLESARRMLLQSNGIESLIKDPSLTVKELAHLECPTCLESKQVSRPFKSREEFRSQSPLGVVHADLTGPFASLSRNEDRYMLGIIDEFSRKVWVFPLQTKDEATPCIIKWAIQMKVEKRLPKQFNSDNGTEFANATLADFWARCGTKQTFSVPYSPQQNGMIERFWRTLKDATRCALHQSKAPWILWADAMLAAAEVYNRSHCDERGNTPNQLFSDVKFNPHAVAALKPWGCTAYPKYNEGQMAQGASFWSTSRKAIFIGYYQNQGYLFAEIIQGKLIVFSSHSAKFLEDDFSAAREMQEELRGTELETYDPFGNDEDIEMDSSSAHLQMALRQSLEEYKQQVEQEKEKDDKEIEHEEDSEMKDEQEPSPAVPEKLRRSARGTKPVTRYGMVSPGDLDPDAAMQAVAYSLSTTARELQQQINLSPHFAALAQKQITPLDRSKKECAQRSDTHSIDALIRLVELDLSTMAFDPQVYEGHQVRVGEEVDRDKEKCLKYYNETIDMNEEDLIPCNSKGVRVMPTQQCAAINKKKRRCKCRTKTGAYCWQHLKQLSGLQIKMSDIAGAGRGLYTTVARNAGEAICPYSGDRLHGDDPDFKGSRYVISLNRNDHVDAARTNAHMGRMINSPWRTGRSSNCKFVGNQANKTVRMQATKFIPAGTELLVDYGNAFFSRVPDAAKMKSGAMKRSKKLIKKASNLARSINALAMKYKETAAPPIDPSFNNLPDPKNFREAMASPDRNNWLKAIEAEETSMLKLNVFTPVNIGSKDKRLGTKWVFKKKRDGNLNVIKYKARIVAQGFNQEPFTDYDETFSPVMSIPALRLLIAIATHFDLELTQVDFETAYLNAELDKLIICSMPQGFTRHQGNTHNAVRLNKALYGLHQSGRLWNLKLVKILKQLGYEPLHDCETCVMIRTLPNGRKLVLGIYVDDILEMWDKRDKADMDADREKLEQFFKLKELGDAKLILGLSIERDRKARITKLHQTAYTEQMCKEFGADKSKAVISPMSSTPISLEDAKIASDLPASAPLNPQNYSSAVGAVMWAANTTRPDVSQAINVLASYTHDPCHAAIRALQHLLRYMQATSSLGITFRYNPSGLKLIGYSDSDYANDAKTRKSRTGILLLVCEAPIYYKSVKQSTVALSSGEAEYIACSEAARGIIFLRKLLTQLGYLDPNVPTELRMDSTAAISIASTEGNAERRKHIDTKHHFIREQVLNDIIELVWVSTDRELADIFTKSLPKDSFIKLRQALLNM